MNILFLLHSVPYSGVDTVTGILANEFVNSGHNVYLCRLDSSDSLVNPKIRHFSIFGDLQKIDTRENIDLLKNAIRGENINIIINQQCQNIPWVNLAKKAMKNSSAKIISCLHFPVLMSVDYFGKRTKFLPKFFARFIKKHRDLKAVNFAYDNSDSLVLLSKKFLEHYRTLQPKKKLNKLRVIANPISFNSEYADLEKKQKTILFVGRISEFQKRLSLIIEIWKIILGTGKYDDWDLKIVGYGEDLENIKKKAEGLDRIYFEGKRESGPYFEKASIFFMTSAFEGWGITLVESLQKACVPIAMDSFLSLGDIIENNENGIVSPNNDIIAFAENAMLLMDNEIMRKKMAVNGMKSIERFSASRISAEWEKLFDELSR
jgi:glycosyltransferase involved in cell wall biosynthesis